MKKYLLVLALLAGCSTAPEVVKVPAADVLAEDTHSNPAPAYLEAEIQTSTYQSYPAPLLKVKDFKAMVDKYAACSGSATTQWKVSGLDYDLLVINQQDSEWNKVGDVLMRYEFVKLDIPQRPISVLRTLDLGRDRIYDNLRFVTPEKIIEMVRKQANSCGS